MKKIVFLTNTLGYGGATKIMVEIANYLSEYFEVEIANYGEEEEFYNINSKIKVVSMPKTKCNIRKVRVLAQLLILRKAIKKQNPDLLVAFTNNDKLFAVGAAIGTKAKVIISERQDPFSYHPGKKHTMWLRYWLADGCVFQTEGAMRYFPKSVQRKSVVINNFIRMEKKPFIPVSEKKKEISFSARFELKQKRQDIMLKAFYIFLQRYPDYKLVFYGDGPDQAEMEKLASELEIDDKVVFAGKTANVTEKIRESAFFVLTSDYEGIPNALLEAMALGVASISTDCNPGGARLLIEDGKNGVLVPPGDIEKLADAMIRYAENGELCDKYGQAAQEVLDIYSPERLLPEWKVYFLKF